jgi:hypothetical protein
MLKISYMMAPTDRNPKDRESSPIHAQQPPHPYTLLDQQWMAGGLAGGPASDHGLHVTLDDRHGTGM